MIKITRLAVCCMLVGILAGCREIRQDNEYVVVAGKGITVDTSWNKVVNALKERHQAIVVAYTDSLQQILPELQRLRPRYVAIVEKPENLNRDYVIGLNRLSREVDDDIFADFLWGIITGYDAANAMQMVNNSAEPLVIKQAVSTVTELNSGKWFDRFAWVDDHQKGVWGEKTAADDSITTYQIEPEEVLQKFYDIYAEYDPDLVVTAAHATERNLEMPFSLGNIKSKGGVLYADFKDDPQDLKESGKRKVYFAVGNCLIGNVDNTDESMAVAWMNSGNAATMIGYVVTTWHGRNGWGGLKYWLTIPGRYSLAEAIYLNQQDFLNQQYEWNPKFLEIEYPYGDSHQFEQQYEGGVERIRQATGIAEPTNDQVGFLHDRDVLAYYGDPKWNVRLQEIAAENDFTVTSEMKGKQCIVTIRTAANFSMERMKGAQFKQEHVLDLPFSYFFPERLNDPRLAAGQNWKAAMDENFLLVYNVDFKPDQTYTITLDVD